MSHVELLVAYEEYLIGLGLDEGTIYNYRGKVARALAVAESCGWDLTVPSILTVARVADAFPKSRASRGILRCALGHFWAMLDVDGPTRTIRVPKAPPWKYRGLSDDEAVAIEERACGWWPEGGAVLLGLYLALRRAEMATLRWEDFEEGMSWVRITGKGGRTRHLPVHEVLRAELAPRAGIGHLFPGQAGRAYVHTGTVRRWIDRVAKAAIGKTVAPHALRHTCLTRMNDETGDLRTVQAFAGHADPGMTARYTRASEARLTEAVASLSYGGRKAGKVVPTGTRNLGTLAPPARMTLEEVTLWAMEADLHGGHLVTVGPGDRSGFQAWCNPDPYAADLCWEGPDRASIAEAAEDGRRHNPGCEPDVLEWLEGFYDD